MPFKLTRRDFSAMAGSMIGTSALLAPVIVHAKDRPNALGRKIAELEKALGTRLGASIHDMETGRH